MSTKWTAADAAKLWMEHHSPEEWRKLLIQYEETPVLSEEVIGWLAQMTASMNQPLMSQLNQGTGLENAKTLAHFEEGFIANISQCLDQAKADSN